MSARQLLLVTAVIGIGAVVVYFGVIYQAPLPDHPVLRGKNDLFLHAVAFLTLSVPLLLLWPWRLVMAGLVALAVGIEVVQFSLPRRTPGWDDLAASMAGILIGCAMVLALRAAGLIRR